MFETRKQGNKFVAQGAKRFNFFGDALLDYFALERLRKCLLSLLSLRSNERQFITINARNHKYILFVSYNDFMIYPVLYHAANNYCANDQKRQSF